MKQEAHTHPKVLDFEVWVDEQVGEGLRAVGISPRALAHGMLEDLWMLTRQHAPAGDIGRFDDRRIARSMGWQRDPGELIEALVSLRLLDRHDTHRLVVHDWSDHSEEYIHMRLARKGERFADGSIPKLGKLSGRDRLEAMKRLHGDQGPDRDPSGPNGAGRSAKQAKETTHDPKSEWEAKDWAPETATTGPVRGHDTATAGPQQGHDTATTGPREGHAVPWDKGQGTRDKGRVGGSRARTSSPVPESPDQAPTHPPTRAASPVGRPPSADLPVSVPEYALAMLDNLRPRPSWLDDPAAVTVARDSLAAAVIRHGEREVREVLAMALSRDAAKTPLVSEIRGALLRWPDALTPKAGRDRVEVAIEALAITQDGSSTSSPSSPGGYQITKGDLEVLWWDAVVARTRAQGRPEFRAGDPNPAEGATAWDGAFRRVGAEVGVRALAAAIYRILDDAELARRFAKDPRVLAEPGVLDGLLGRRGTPEIEKRISSPSGGLSPLQTTKDPAVA